MRIVKPAVILTGLFAFLTSSLLVQAGELPVKDGQKIAFLGDSITEGGVKPNGYVTLAIKGLETNGVKAAAIPAGVSGNKSNQMLNRLEKDVLNKKPDWMTLSCGVNDVWHGKKGIPLEEYKTNITKIVDLCQAANIKVMILTATMIGEDPANENNQKLIPYNEFLRSLAKEKNCLLADLNTEMQAGVAAAGGGKNSRVYTRDGVHMNDAGNIMMATGVLKAFGLSDAQISNAHKAWAEAAEAAKAAADRKKAK